MIRTTERPRRRTGPTRRDAPIGSAPNWYDCVEAPGFAWGHRGGHDAHVLCDDSPIAVHRHVRAVDFDAMIAWSAGFVPEGHAEPVDLVLTVGGLVLAVLHYRPGKATEVSRFMHPAELRVI